MKGRPREGLPARVTYLVARRGDEGYPHAQNLLYLIWGRLAFLLLWVVFVLVFTPESFVRPATFESKCLLGSTAAYGAMSLFYLLYWYRVRRGLYWFAFAQVILDLPFWTVLVLLTGGAGSFFAFLYHISIMAGAVYCGVRGIVFPLIAGITLYTLQGLVQPMGWVPDLVTAAAHAGGQRPAELFVQMGIDIASMMIVAMLSGFLVLQASRAGEKLRKVQAVFNDLNQLNDAIISSFPSAMVTTDSEGFVKALNQEAKEIFGLDENTLRDRPVNALLGISSAELARDHVTKDISLPSRKGGDLIYKCTAAALIDSRGERVGSVIHLVDITDRLRLQEDLNRMERASALGHMAVGFAHEIRNPIASISGSVEMIMQYSSMSPTDKKLLQIILRESRRLDSMITALLHLSTPERITLTVFPLKEMVDDVIDFFKGSETTAHVGLRADVPPGIPVRADRDRIHRVLFNLLKNAAESMTPAGGIITVDASRLGEERVEVRVTDEGCGVNPESVDKLFDPYFTTKDYGIGMGLSICRKILMRHGESIGYRPSTPAGSTFYFTLKLAQAPKEEGAPSSAT